MANTAIGFGVALIVLGVVGYFGTGAESLTAMIPAAFGILLVIFGLVARNPNHRRHAMHGAALVALLGVLGSGRGLPKILPLLSGEAVDRPNAVIAQAVMALLCLTFVALCIKSFIDARRSRTARS